VRVGEVEHDRHAVAYAAIARCYKNGIDYDVDEIDSKPLRARLPSKPNQKTGEVIRHNVRHATLQFRDLTKHLLTLGFKRVHPCDKRRAGDAGFDCLENASDAGIDFFEPATSRDQRAVIILRTLICLHGGGDDDGNQIRCEQPASR